MKARSRRRSVDTPPGPDTADPFTGFIIVRLERAYQFTREDTLLGIALAHEDLRAVRALLKKYELDRSTPAIVSIPYAEVEAWERGAASHSGLAPTHSLLQYWRVDVRKYPSHSEGRRPSQDSIAAEFWRTDGVDTAYREAVVEPPSVNPADDPKALEQTYLDPPKNVALPNRVGGIDARGAWAFPGADGAGVRLVDIEFGWIPTHPDLQAQSFLDLGGPQALAWKGHGTRVLGIVAGVDNDMGVVGIAPNVKQIVLATVLLGSIDEQLQFTADAILRAIDKSDPGDVLLVELQTKKPVALKYPVECDDLVYDAIRLASALGRVVVESAGNGAWVGGNHVGIDLDGYELAGNKVLSRSVRDSGAILVAACAGTSDYLPKADSNYGTRIDCFAPGEAITTTDDPEIDDGYTSSFGQTSAASAIVAGAALAVQGMWLARTGSLLLPLQLRALLSDPTINTHQGPSPRRIGVMPLLTAIATQVLPDVYLRDRPLDDGGVPNALFACLSPDIVLRTLPDPRPQNSFGEASGTEQRTDLSDPLIPESEQVLYARVRNRGPVDAPGATVTFYCSPPAPLSDPSEWTLIGTTAPFDVPTGGALTVSAPLKWNSGDHRDIPANPCLVAVVNQSSDLAPPLPIPADPDGPAITSRQLTDFFRSTNNIARRNLLTVPLAAPATKKTVSLPFLLFGSADATREFVIELVARHLPCRAELHVPHALRNQFDVVENDLRKTGGLRPRAVLLGRGARHECEIRLCPPLDALTGAEELFLRQWCDGVEVGRLTWRFGPDRSAIPAAPSP